MTSYGRIYEQGMGYVDYYSTAWVPFWTRMKIRRFRKKLDACILAAFQGQYPASISIPSTLTYYRLEIELTIAGVVYPTAIGFSQEGTDCSYCITAGGLLYSGLIVDRDLRLFFRDCRRIVAQATEDETGNDRH